METLGLVNVAHRDPLALLSAFTRYANREGTGGLTSLESVSLSRAEQLLATESAESRTNAEVRLDGGEV